MLEAIDEEGELKTPTQISLKDEALIKFENLRAEAFRHLQVTPNLDDVISFYN